jgi:hypothetical protein
MVFLVVLLPFGPWLEDKGLGLALAMVLAGSIGELRQPADERAKSQLPEQRPARDHVADSSRGGTATQSHQLEDPTWRPSDPSEPGLVTPCSS